MALHSSSRHAHPLDVPAHRRRSGVKISVVWTGVIAAATSACLTGCQFDWGPPGPAPTSASADVSLSWPTPPGATCSNKTALTWQAAPVQLGPGTGKAEPQSRTVPPVGDFPPAGSTCALHESFTDLRPGTWTFTVTAGTSRSVSLTAGANTVDLSH